MRWANLPLIGCWTAALACTASAQTPAPTQPRVPSTCQLIATGGTIAMKIDPVKRAPVPALSGEDLVASVPDLAKVATVRVENLFNVPSDYIDAARWLKLRESVARALDQ